VGLEVFLIHEVRAVPVGIKVRSRDHLEVGFLESVGSLESLVKNSPSEEIAHLEANEGLSTAGAGGVHFGVQADIRSVFVFEESLALDINSVDQGSHQVLYFRIANLVSSRTRARVAVELGG
jgi:hypothetical protein